MRLLYSIYKSIKLSRVVSEFPQKPQVKFKAKVKSCTVSRCPNYIRVHSSCNTMLTVRRPQGGPNRSQCVRAAREDSGRCKRK